MNTVSNKYENTDKLKELEKHRDDELKDILNNSLNLPLKMEPNDHIPKVTVDIREPVPIEGDYEMSSGVEKYASKTTYQPRSEIAIDISKDVGPWNTSAIEPESLYELTEHTYLTNENQIIGDIL